MSDIKKWVLVVGGGLAIVATVLMLVGGPDASPAQAQGVQWEELSIEDALRRAEAEDKRVFVKFDAEWCTYCEHLDEEVLSTARGGSLTHDMIAVRYDFDEEANRQTVERYVVLGLPTSLVLTPDGTQVGRIQGYSDADEWVGELEAAKTADDPTPALRDAYSDAPDNPNAALRLGEALLVRGEVDEGQMLLERVTWLSGESADEAAAEALFLLGRYYHRVRQEPATARHIWRELAARYPDSDWAGGAWWWYARAEAELGHPELGSMALHTRVEADPTDASAVSQWADFVLTRELDDERAAAQAAVDRALQAAGDDDRGDLEELLARFSTD